MTSVWKPTPIVVIINVQDDEEVVIGTEENEVALTEVEINSFSRHLPWGRIRNWMTTGFAGRTFFVDTANVMYIKICDQANAKFSVKISGMNVISLCNTGTNLSCIPYVCFMKLKDLPSL